MGDWFTDKVDDLSVEQYNIDNEMLTNLIKFRGYLWT